MVDVGRRKFLTGAGVAAAGAAASTVMIPQAKAAPLSARVDYPSNRLANVRDLKPNEPLNVAYPDNDDAELATRSSPSAPMHWKPRRTISSITGFPNLRGTSTDKKRAEFGVGIDSHSGPTALTGENESQSERRERDQNVAAGAVHCRKDLFAQSAGRPDGVQRKMQKLPREVGAMITPR
jgi:hypothetical protein